jgi:uncharacterized protein (DUF983 family)
VARRRAARSAVLIESELRLATPRQAARLFGRAAILSCPQCGGRPVLVHWLRLRERCAKCGLRLERGEHDHFTGAMLFNFIISELIFAALFIGYIIVVWPDVNWDIAQWVLVAMIAAAPVIMYPISKLTWLAFDLMLRPASSEELDSSSSLRTPPSATGRAGFE